MFVVGPSRILDKFNSILLLYHQSMKDTLCLWKQCIHRFPSLVPSRFLSRYGTSVLHCTYISFLGHASRSARFVYNISTPNARVPCFGLDRPLYLRSESAGQVNRVFPCMWFITAPPAAHHAALRRPEIHFTVNHKGRGAKKAGKRFVQGQALQRCHRLIYPSHQCVQNLIHPLAGVCARTDVSTDETVTMARAHQQN